AVIALFAGDEMAPSGLAALEIILPRELHRRLVGLGAARDEIDVAEIAGGAGDQMLGQRLGRLVCEEACVGIGQTVELRLDRVYHSPLAVAQTRNGGAARSVEITLAGAVDDEGPVAADRHGQVAAGLTVKDTGAIGGHAGLSSGR